MADKTKKRSNPTKKHEFDDFRLWLAGLGMANPSLHINGAVHSNAVITVDFGTPLTEQKLDSDQTAELVSRLRSGTKALFPDKEVNVRVQNDTGAGIWWASIN